MPMPSGQFYSGADVYAPDDSGAPTTTDVQRLGPHSVVPNPMAGYSPLVAAAGCIVILVLAQRFLK